MLIGWDVNELILFFLTLCKLPTFYPLDSGGLNLIAHNTYWRRPECSLRLLFVVSIAAELRNKINFDKFHHYDDTTTITLFEEYKETNNLDVRINCVIYDDGTTTHSEMPQWQSFWGQNIYHLTLNSISSSTWVSINSIWDNLLSFFFFLDNMVCLLRINK